MRIAGVGCGKRRLVTSTRLLGYAVLTVVYSLAVLLLAVGVIPGLAGIVFAVVFLLPLLWSWGAYQAHLELNEGLDEVERQRWRIAFYLVPPTMAAYWWRQVRAPGD